MSKEKEIDNNSKEETPPFFSSWNKLYAIVFITFAVLVILFYIFTKAFE